MTTCTGCACRAADIRSLFLAYLEQSNQLVGTPRFYNTVTVNCTTLVYRMLRHIVGALPFSYRVLFSGYLPEYVYSLGGLDGRYTLTELRELGRITERAQTRRRPRGFFGGDPRGNPGTRRLAGLSWTRSRDNCAAHGGRCTTAPYVILTGQTPFKRC